jgi:hypothetical protein
MQKKWRRLGVKGAARGWDKHWLPPSNCGMQARSFK